MKGSLWSFVVAAVFAGVLVLGSLNTAGADAASGTATTSAVSQLLSVVLVPAGLVVLLLGIGAFFSLTR